jgi:telomerase reverse transcriptase
LQVVGVAWLQPPGQEQTTKLAHPDFEKRKELLQEFIYWFFDSFLVPLIRSNFHVTETNMHKNRLFYFRHDVWRLLTESSLTTMKLSMFEEMPTERVPKKHGFRTITNLKRRQQIVRNGGMSLGRSINSAMMPVFHAINHEKVSIKLGSQTVNIYLQ